MARSSPHGASLLPLALLLLPPLGNVVWNVARKGGEPGQASTGEQVEGVTPASDPVSLLAQIEGQRVRVAGLEQMIQSKDEELKLLRGWRQLQPRYAALRADVIALGDLSPRRSSFAVYASSGLDGVRVSTPVVFRDALVGRVERLLETGLFGNEGGLARVQTLRDPYFRVRFRYREASGFLLGTGTTDAQGYPLLELRYLDVEVGFKLDEAVTTEGGDGRFPRDLVIGFIVRSDTSRSDALGYRVRGAFRLDQLREVALLVDQAALQANALLNAHAEASSTVPSNEATR